jgi:hypothetical protein
MDRKLIDGTLVPEFLIPQHLQIKTKCPAKWKLVDMETGEEYAGQLPTEWDNKYWKKIS